jgi:hypothetical protein
MPATSAGASLGDSASESLDDRGVSINPESVPDRVVRIRILDADPVITYNKPVSTNHGVKTWDEIATERFRAQMDEQIAVDHALHASALARNAVAILQLSVASLLMPAYAQYAAAAAHDATARLSAASMTMPAPTHTDVQVAPAVDNAAPAPLVTDDAEAVCLC